MEKENKSIHELDLSLISDYFGGIERQGPGSPEITVKALGFITGLSGSSRIADIGCGAGGQTITLAKHAPGTITGLDLFPEFIEKLNAQAEKENLQSRLKGVQGNMEELPFEKESLDVIWSEGAIYNVGFEKGLKEWREYLKPGGWLAVSEASWFTEERPHEIEDFWMNAYPEIDTVPNKLAQVQKAGYLPVATFLLPEYCWTDNFFKPQEPMQREFLARHNNSQSAEEMVRYMLYEARLYEKYSRFYGYAFYIGQKL